MPNRLARSRPHFHRHVPAEVLTLLGSALAIFLVVTLGAAIAAVLPEQESPWLFASAYLAPAGVAFVAYWWIAQRL